MSNSRSKNRTSYKTSYKKIYQDRANKRMREFNKQTKQTGKKPLKVL